jgi:hypothetical protein
MAQIKKNAKRTYYELVFEGKPKMVRAFLSGLVMGTGAEADIYYSYDEGVFHEGKVEKIAEMARVRAKDCHVIVDWATNPQLKKLKKRILAEAGLEITSQKNIRSASVEFCFEAYAARYNDEIVALLKGIPKGLKVQGFKHDVRLDPKAKGPEAYSPVHHYEAKGQGTVTGRVDLVIDLKRKFGDYPLIKSEDVRLKLA